MEKNVGQFVASQLQIPVGINCVIINNKRLVGDSLRLLDKPVQHCTHAGCQFKQLQPHSVPDHLHQKEEIPPEVREAEFLHNISGKETCGQRIEPAQSCAHVCVRKATKRLVDQADDSQEAAAATHPTFKVCFINTRCLCDVRWLHSRHVRKHKNGT
ncbi:hypothetical protein ATANTOWER_018236 [Ataeniobius toweri]|uniref:Uncharacterized protein n=1 Tax=Ataeniobius toweri TaxID=208326 RepID=A0ABU7B176_9TELE|nr:hypothetical protein [Ataeniobius toweri]